MVHLEHYPAEKLKREILAIIGKHVDLSQYRVFFFGSRVSSMRDRSDIDIGISGPQPVSPETLFKIREDIDRLPILYKIDVVDFRRASKEFRRVAEKNAEVVSCPS